MTFAIQLFLILMISGLMLLGAEIFVPGGVLGAVGAMALVGAIGMAFAAFGPTAGAYIALATIVLLGVVIVLWIKIFPNTSVGRRMTVSNDMADSKATETGLQGLLGQEGVATSELRPAGFAVIGGRRVDVVTQGGMIDKGTAIKVVEVESNRVVVAKSESASSPQSAPPAEPVSQGEVS